MYPFSRHTGIVVYGNEYFFGGGIQHLPVGRTPYGTPIRTIELGLSHVPKDVFEMYLEEISPRYTAESYNLLTHNCNNFSNEVAQFLVGKGIPDYILQLPNDVLNSPMGGLISKSLITCDTFLEPLLSRLHYCSNFISPFCSAYVARPRNNSKGWCCSSSSTV